MNEPDDDFSEIFLEPEPAPEPFLPQNVDTSEERLHPWFRDRFRQLLKLIEAEGLAMRVFETYRDPRRQDWLYAQGRTRPGNVVTYARSGRGPHEYGLAADFVLDLEDVHPWSSAPEHAPIWERFGEIVESVGLDWGGRWVKFQDRSHIQMPKWRALRSRG